MTNTIKWPRVTTLFLVLICAVQPSLICAENTPDQPAKAEILTEIQLKMQQEISVDFSETPIEDVLRILAKQADVDIVKSPKVVGNVTATLSDIPLEEALDNILAAHGYGYIPTKNMIRIVPREEIYDAPEKMVNRVYKITYADVAELEKVLSKFLSSRGSISSMPGTSNIIVSDTEGKIEAIDRFIEEVDRVTQQVLVEVRIYDVTDTDRFDLDIQWNAGRNTPITDISRTKTSGTSSTHSTTDVGDTVEVTETVRTETETTDEAGDVVEEDKTVTTTTGGTSAGRVADSTTNETTSGDNTTETTDRTWQRDTYSKSKPFVGGSFNPSTGGTLRFGVLNDIVDIELVLNMLHKEEWAVLLANPSIMVLDNETATFEIIEEIPYKDVSNTSNGGQLTSTQFKEVGVKLEVTPHITRDDMLKLRIVPEFSVSEAQTRNPVTLEPIVPTVNTRRLDTIALLQNGSTVVLGGLRKQKVVKNLSKVPLFGDLPLLGGLFRSENEESKTTEVLVFITPTIIDVSIMESDEAQAYEYTNIRKAKYPLLRKKK